ncbi:ABC transporter ATP-binding protein [Leptospira wolffii]|uniref:ABC transporter ATP-binding protein n=1 Tax=Leptospira wolffii TaxID=409998 RepID=A0A2M9Z6Z9_9LEPT|nr:ABC transporter ATP-binding protein [Leptospira wolffii]
MALTDPSLLLKIKSLSVRAAEKLVLQDFDFEIRKGEIHSLVGESGSGKSTLARLILGLLPEGLESSWSEFEIFGLGIPPGDFGAWKNWRGNRISYIPQTSSLGLHPFLSIGSQMREYFSLIRPELSARKVGIRLLEEAGLANPNAAWDSRPHQLSGGERQRVLILLSLYSGAELILADEPTSALDPRTGGAILELLEKRVRDLGSTLLFISHDLGSAKSLADTITVMRSGQKVETLKKEEGTWSPRSEYSRKLFTLEENLA